MRALPCLLLLALAAAACGGGDGNRILLRAERGLARVHDRTLELHLRVETLLPIERTEKLDADEVPLRRLRLTRWVDNPRRFSCGERLECARGEVDAERALRELEPLLPDLPLDPDSIHSAKLEVGIGRSDGRPRFLRLRGEVEPGLGGDVPFEAELTVPP